ncbi:MAG TPA: flagellar FliJ family protein [Candidatus Hydrogenedentes bacterium]|nr:flagellar FliJ family protein [Candidatus Hydrogenedentota bacterium]HPG67896.1 flagellar FliJ family protein [Candidatus Hydrogenedentota bacterium]
MAKAKPFRYDTLLRIRKRQEDRCAQSLAEAHRSLGAAERRREAMRMERRRALDKAGEAAVDRFDASDIRRYYQHERHLTHMVTKTDADIVNLKETVRRRRMDLDEAMTRRRALERLRERRQAAYWKEVAKEWQKASDELATNRSAMEGITERRAAVHADASPSKETR